MRVSEKSGEPAGVGVVWGGGGPGPESSLLL